MQNPGTQALAFPMCQLQVLKLYHPLALRWFLVSTHYRAPVNYSSRALDEASSRLYYVLQALLDVSAALRAAGAWRCCALLHALVPSELIIVLTLQ